MPWQVTGNHWLSLPCIHPADGSVHALGVLHRGARAALEFAGTPDFLSGHGTALLRPTIAINGTPRELASLELAWERALGWIPTFTCSVDGLLVRGTLFAPHGRDADLAGAVYAIAIDNRSNATAQVAIWLEGVLGHRQLRVRSPRAADDAHRVIEAEEHVVVLEGTG